MKLTVDKEADALYMRLSDTRICDSEEVKPGVILDYDENNNLVGIGILRVFLKKGEERMNQNVIAGIIIVGVIIGFCIFFPGTMRQNEVRTIAVNTSLPYESPTPFQPSLKPSSVPEEPVFASFGLDTGNPDRTVFLDNPALMDAFINASKTDISPWFYPQGLIIGYGKDNNDGSIVILLNPDERVNQSDASRIYSHIAAAGRAFNITIVPCKFFRAGIVIPDAVNDMAP